MTKPRAYSGSAELSRCRPRKRCAIALPTLLLLSTAGCGLSPVGHDWDSYPSRIETLARQHANRDPVEQSQQRGRAVYDHYCQICHGPQAEGNGFNAAMLNPPPRNFADDSFWQRVDDTHMVSVISRGGRAVDKSILMPAWGRTLDEHQIRDVIAYLRTVPQQAKQKEQATEKFAAPAG